MAHDGRVWHGLGGCIYMVQSVYPAQLSIESRCEKHMAYIWRMRALDPSMQFMEDEGVGSLNSVSGLRL